MHYAWVRVFPSQLLDPASFLVLQLRCSTDRLELKAHRFPSNNRHCVGKSEISSVALRVLSQALKELLVRRQMLINEVIGITDKKMHSRTESHNIVLNSGE